MPESTLDRMLEMISNLSLEDQEFLVDTVTHRINDAKREQILFRAKQAEANYQLGEVETGTVDDSIGSLDRA